jgi:hypothetical protein
MPDLHTLVDEYTRALHHYVDVAAGVRAESSGPAEAGEDPRLEVAAREAALAMGRLEDACTSGLGLTADVGMAWVEDTVEGTAPDVLSPEEPVGEDAAVVHPDDEDLVADAFHLHFAVLAALGPGGDPLDGVLEVVEEAGYEVVTRLEEAGYEVPEFGISRGDPEPFDFLAGEPDEDDEDDEDEDDAPGPGDGPGRRGRREEDER